MQNNTNNNWMIDHIFLLFWGVVGDSGEACDFNDFFGSHAFDVMHVYWKIFICKFYLL